MLKSEISDRYHIDNTFDRHTIIDDLYSGGPNDPLELAHQDALICGLAEDNKGKQLPYDVVVGIGPNGNCLTQIIVFNDEDGYEDYLSDGILIFDYRE